MQLTTHFSLEELTVSQTAARFGFTEQFEPSAEVVKNLTNLASRLEIARILLGSPIIVSSGYRCPRVNEKVDGATDSAHLLGLAADFTVPGFGNPIAVCNRLGATRNLEFDQIIYEYGQWCHFGIGPPGNRRQLLSKFYGDNTYHVGIIPRP